jgi:hypothetical protein
MRLWNLSNAGDAQGVGRDPLMLAPSLSPKESWRFCLGREIRDIARILFLVEALGSHDDMPWTVSCVFAASNRLKAVLELELPSHAQFIPAQVQEKAGDAFMGDEYWALNWLHIIECMDPERSQYELVEDPNEPSGSRYSFDRLVVDPRKVPDNIHIFRVREFCTKLIVTDTGRSILEDAGITGCQFYDVR